MGGPGFQTCALRIYNRRSRFPERALWVRLTEEPFPRLSVVRRVRPGAGVFLGPFPDRRAADSAVAAVHESLPLRQCTTRLSDRKSTRLNSSHANISYAVFCLNKKKNTTP